MNDNVIYYNKLRNEVYKAILVEVKKHRLQKFSNKLEQWFRTDCEKEGLEMTI